MLFCQWTFEEREDPALRPAGALRSEDSKTVPTPATNRARQIGDSLEHLLSGAQQAWWVTQVEHSNSSVVVVFSEKPLVVLLFLPFLYWILVVKLGFCMPLRFVKICEMMLQSI